MESWDNLIVQWINCLLDNSDDCIQSTEELHDGRKYLKLISKLKRFQCKIDDDDASERDIVIQFLKDEYPNIVFGTKTRAIENLCVALLILSRLSLEPAFHKSLCSSLNLDAQVRIKSILESLYPLGKKVTIENLCSAFSLLDKSMTGSCPAKPRFLLEDFLNSPAIKSVHSDSKIHEQTKQIRHLQADLETVRYEKSELIEDIKIQKRQIDELHKKLQETLLELKNLRQDSLKSSDFNGSYEPTTPKSLESSYEKELQSLENYISELQTDNFKLIDEKNSLMDELKICKEKYNSIEEKSLKHEEMIESLLIQIEKKDGELIELRLKYEELGNYLKERSKPLFINQSFDVEDRSVTENSIINSETLSSVIEVQLQDAKKEILEAQNKYKSINSLLTMVMEEYVKLKKSVQTLLSDNAKIRADYEKKYKIVYDQLQSMLNEEKIKKQSEFHMYRELDVSEIQRNMIKVLLTDSGKMDKSLLLNLLNQYNASKGIQQPKSHIDSTTADGNSIAIVEADSTCLNTVQTLQKYQGQKIINNADKSKLVFKFYDILWQDNWRKNLLTFFEALLQNNNNVSDLVTDEITSHESIVVRYNSFDSILEKNLIKCLQDIYSKIEDEEASLISMEDLEIIRSDWILLYTDIKDNLKLHKVIILLDKKWNIVSESFKNFDYFDVGDMKELLEKKNIIDTEFSKIYFMNSQILSFNFIAAAQLTTKINKTSKEKLLIEDLNDSMLHASFNCTLDPADLLTHSEFIEKIISINKSIKDFENLKKTIESKPQVITEWANISIQTELIEAEPVAETECANVSIQTENPPEPEIEPAVQIDFANVSMQTDVEIKTELVNVSLQTEDQTEPTVKIECPNVSLQTENLIEDQEPAIKVEYANISLQTENAPEDITTESEIKVEYANVSLQTSLIEPVVETECANVSLQTSLIEPVVETKCANVSLQTSLIDPVVETECANVSLQTSLIDPVVKIECANVSLQTDDLPELLEAKAELVNVSLQTDNVAESTETQVPVKIECVNVSMQTDNPEELSETKPSNKINCVNVSLQTESEPIIEPPHDVRKKMKFEKEILQQQNQENKENILNKTAKSSKSVLDSEEVQQYVQELHEKYELKLEKMKEKMKSVYNSQIGALKKDHESVALKRIQALEEKLKQQCDSHSVELKKYKKHVSELSTQLWDVGERLLIEKQKNEEVIHKYKELKTKQDIMEPHSSKVVKHEPQSRVRQVSRAEVERMPLEELEVSSVSKLQNVRNFQVMGNAFRTEDEEGELFDTTYNLAELQRSQNIPPGNDIDRLSVLQMRNAKCKPHLKSSYPAEMQSYPLPVTEDEIKAGSASEEVFNNSLSESLLTGKRVKRKDRTRNGSETPRRSTRRFSNIFRKPRLSLDRK